MSSRLTALLSTAAAALLLAPAAQAGEFVVISCGESPANETAGWTISAPTSTLDTGEQCPPVLDQPGASSNRSKHTGIYLTDKLSAATDTPAGAAVSATFNAPAGTTITRARLWRFYTQFNDGNWRMLGSTLEGEPLDSCTIVEGGCFLGGSNYLAGSEQVDGPFRDFSGLSTHGIRYRLSCEAPAGLTCGNGATLYRASLSLFGSKLTVFDPSAPTVQAPSGALWTASGYQRGSLALTATSGDNTGISATQLLVDELIADTDPRTCNYSRPVPCTDEPAAALSLNTATLADGPHTIAVQALDAASNPGAVTRSSQLLVDNTAPAAPQDLRTSDGAATRSTNSWQLGWTLLADAGSPVVRAHYTVCPSGFPDSTRCETRQAAGAGITQLPAFALPSSGAWDVRVSLEDELGFHDPARARSITLAYEPPADPTPPTTTPTTTSGAGTTSSTPPPSTGPVTPPIVGQPPAAPKRAASLRVTRAPRAANTLRVSGTTTKLAAGSVRVTYSARVGGRTLRLTRTARLAQGRYSVALRLTGRLARSPRGTLQVSYAGSTRVLAQTVRRTLARR